MARPTFAGEMVDILGREITSGHIPEGGALNTDQLMERFDVSRTVVREAVKVLESMGLVDVRRRTGLRVRPFGAWNVLDPSIIRWRLAQPDPAAALRSLTELRESIEPVAARLAALRPPTATPTTDLLARLSESVDGMAESVRAHDRRSFLDWDLVFHETVVAASGNELFQALGRSIRGVLEGQTQSGIMPIEDGTLTVELHRAIADAVLAQDGQAAESATRALFADMRAHFSA